MHHLQKIASTSSRTSGLVGTGLRALYSRPYSVSTSTGTSVGTAKDEAEPSSAKPVMHLDRELSLLGPKDIRLPLPGNVGVVLPTNTEQTPSVNFPRMTDTDIYRVEINEDRQRKVYCKLINLHEETGLVDETQELLECKASDCPDLLKKDFQELFPGRDLRHEALTVITVSRRTENDMSGWCQTMDLEREQLVEEFITMAKRACRALNMAGYWADFIDPTSGRPYLGRYTNATLFETDERYRNFGFTIEDLGCCKVLTHHMWGTNTFVGSLFTNAPVKNGDVERILQKSMLRHH